MNRQKWLIPIISVIIIIIIATVVIMQLRPFSRYPERSPHFLIIETTIAYSAPLRDDFIKRGLYKITEQNGVKSVEIRIGDIEKLIDAGVYAVDEKNFVLISGPNYRPP